MITKDTVSSDEVIINAPVALVWQVLTDFPNYGQWNTFCPSCEATLEIGSPVKMQVDLGFGLQEQVEFMSLIELESAIAWAMENKPEDPIHAVRTQYLKKLSDTSCSYLSVDVFSGPAAADMMGLMAGPVEAGFNRCAYDLKAHCESLLAGSA